VGGKRSSFNGRMALMSLRDIPRKYSVLYSKRLKSRKSAIRSQCLECCGYQESEVVRCTDEGCPLFSWRRNG
jgi:hypothetical protein